MRVEVGSSGGGREDQGFVLIAVAGLLLLLSIISMSLILASQSSLKARFARNAHAEVAAFADGMVRLAAHRLARQRGEATGPVQILLDGTPAWCRDGDLVSGVRIYDTAGLIDLNQAPFETLELVLSGVGLDKAQAANVAAAIVDFRDPDGTPSVGGAEALEYAQAGRAYGPKNAPFESVDELDQVLGVTPELIERIRSFLTVHSRSPGLDPNLAPVALLGILSRTQGGIELTEMSSNQRAQLSLPPQVGRRSNARRSRNRLPVMIIRSQVTGANGAAFLREATVELSSQSAAGFIIRDWTSRSVTSFRAARPAGPLPPCIGG